jgi:hypothetical protein
MQGDKSLHQHAALIFCSLPKGIQTPSLPLVSEIKPAEENLEFLMKIIPPTWLLSHTIHLGFSLHY